MSDFSGDRFSRLLKSLTLREITPMELLSKRLGDIPQGVEMQLEWKQAFADGDPVLASPEIEIFRPKFDFFVRQGTAEVFHQTSIFILAFNVVDPAAFRELWAEESLRKVFMEKQIQRTMWPIFRQHVIDGMSRLAMQPIPLPWLI